MHYRNRLFITAGLIYGLLGGLLGMTWAIAPELIPGHATRIHGHLMLLGFVAMMIYGIGLHVLPRFAGRALFSDRLANWQFWIANLGLLGMLAGWLLLNNTVVSAAGLLAWVAMILFTTNVLLTVRHYGPKG